MKLSELKQLKESASADVAKDTLLNAICDEFSIDRKNSMTLKIFDYLVNNSDDDKVDDFLYAKFAEDDHKIMSSDDPRSAIASKMEQIFKRDLADYHKALK